jgi:cGMP-dependent protein kinase
VKGLSLEQVMSYIGILSNNDSVFYAASIILALEYLHQRDILYRDLAPENVIIDQEGYVCLVDFSSARLVQGRTYTLIGTAFYTAPEVIVGRGYGKSADLWSLGVLIFELLCGFVPFGHEESDPYRVYELILSKNLEFPSDRLPSDPAVTLVKNLLNKYSEQRLNETIENVKNFEWFSAVDWEDLYCKLLIPPYKPIFKKNLDDCLDEYVDPEQEWDYIIQNDIDQRSNSSPLPTDPEIEEYRNSVPHNWDNLF